MYIDLSNPIKTKVFFFHEKTTLLLLLMLLTFSRGLALSVTQYLLSLA